MNLCDDGHEEICHGNHVGDCPVCSLIAAHEGEIDNLKDKIEKLESQIAELEEGEGS